MWRRVLHGMLRFVCLCLSVTVTIHLFPKIVGRQIFVNERQLQEGERLRDALRALWREGIG